MDRDELVAIAARWPFVGSWVVASVARLCGDTTTEFEDAPEYLS